MLRHTTVSDQKSSVAQHMLHALLRSIGLEDSNGESPHNQYECNTCHKPIEWEWRSQHPLACAVCAGKTIEDLRLEMSHSPLKVFLFSRIEAAGRLLEIRKEANREIETWEKHMKRMYRTFAFVLRLE